MNLAADVYFAVIDERSVALDLGHDRYVALGEQLTQALLKFTGPDMMVQTGRQDLAASRILLARGLLSPTPSTSPRPAAQTVTDSLWASPTTALFGPRKAIALGALSALAVTASSLRLRPIGTTVAMVKHAKQRSQARPPALTAADLLDAYQTVRPWFPIKPICRLDAIALALHLNWNRQPADLVFGVRLDPFHAHCWVQRGAEVLNEPVETIRKYTPIMVV
jgi:hypothetical protein